MHRPATGCAAPTNDLSLVFSFAEAALCAPPNMKPAPVAFRNRSLRHFSPDAQSETTEPKLQNGNACSAPSVPRDRSAGGIEDRFRERKLEHDLAFVVGHLDGRIQERAVGAIGLEQFPDHGARHFP